LQGGDIDVTVEGLVRWKW